ncbi:MAG: alpha/beta fold hydrolase [Mycobacteriales bacterium]
MPDTRYAEANGLELAYETFGDPAAPPVVLVMGLGTQMVAWPEALCEQVAAAGRYVVRYDNRDVGLSTHLDDLPVPDVKAVALGRRRPAYRVEDMAEDLVGLLDALGLERAHLVGASMGGFIVQTATIAHPERVLSQTLIMTSTGSRRVGQAKPALVARLARGRRAGSREETIEAAVETFRLIGSRSSLFDEAHLREVAAASYDRSSDVRGYLRQLGATIAQTNRTKALTQVTVPTLVVHGLHDPLVAPSGGLALARLVRGARFVGFSGMGHDLPPVLWGDLAREICQITG